MYYINGDDYKGLWKNNEKNGEWALYLKKYNKIYKGILKNNKRIKKLIIFLTNNNILKFI